jgi:hypothetical protein
MRVARALRMLAHFYDFAKVISPYSGLGTPYPYRRSTRSEVRPKLSLEVPAYCRPAVKAPDVYLHGRQSLCLLRISSFNSKP